MDRTPGSTRASLDATDRRILRLLQENGRMSFSDIGRSVGLTPPAAAERVRRLETRGVITGYHAQIDLEKAGLGILAYIRVQSPVELANQLSDLARDIPEILEFHHVTGSEGLVAKVAVSSVAHLEQVIVRLLPYGQTNTAVVLSSPVTFRIIDPAEEA